MSSDQLLASAFEAERPRLVAVAQRILGGRADAEDVVQETWLRLARQEPGSIENLSGWLTTVVGRACIDELRARRAGVEEVQVERLPDLVVVADEGGPEADAVLADGVGLALLVVLESLRPEERLAFVLHDLFAVPFQEIGRILDKSADAAKMAASRARRKVQGAPVPTSSRTQQRAVVDAFVAAVREGELAELLRLLHPDVALRAHGARGLVAKRGAAEVVEALQGGALPDAVGQPVSVNGVPGVIVRDRRGRARALVACTVVDGRIVDIIALADLKRLAAMDLPVP
jgi:RNA polymerase sigma-70 factor (ECF subfamily)